MSNETKAPQPAAEVKGLPAEEVNALPEHARKYIMWLETDADPAGTVRENFRLTEENKALRVMISQQPAAVDEAMVERAATAYLQSRGTYEGEVPVDRDDMRAALTAALMAT